MMLLLAQQMSQDELIRSLTSSMDKGGGDATGILGTAGLMLMGAVVLMLMLAWISWRKERKGNKRLNHPGKLQREIMRKVGIRPAEMKKLKTFAEEVDVSSPLVLLLCPSLMAEAARKRRNQ